MEFHSHKFPSFRKALKKYENMFTIVHIATRNMITDLRYKIVFCVNIVDIHITRTQTVIQIESSKFD